jgi:hypothetical protein
MSEPTSVSEPVSGRVDEPSPAATSAAGPTAETETVLDSVVREEVDPAGDQLGEAVEGRSGRVRGRAGARRRAARIARQAQFAADQGRQSARLRAVQLRSRAVDRTSVASARIRQTRPAGVRAATRRATGTVGSSPRFLAVIAGAMTVVGLVAWRRRRR